MNTELVSGPGRQLAALVEPLREYGIEVVVVSVLLPDATDSPFTKFLRESNVPFEIVRTDGKLRPALIRDVRRAIDSISPHIVQTHSYRPAFIAWCLRHGGTPWRWVGFFHGETYEDLKVRVYNWIDARLLRHADAVVVVASTQLERFRRHKLDVIQIPNAVIPVRASGPNGQSIRDLVMGMPGPRVGFVGRLSYEKGLDVLLEAISLLQRRGLVMSLLVAGDGLERQPAEAQARRLGLGDRVRFLGTVHAVDELYQALDLLVLPSRAEGMPNTLLEAASFDLPIVASSVGDVPAILGGSVAGLIVPPDDADALAEAINQALTTGRSESATAARAEVVRRHSLRERARAHATLYNRVMGQDVCT